MVYANIDGVDEQADFSEDNLNRLTFTYQPTTPHFIPMWGVKQLENILSRQESSMTSRPSICSVQKPRFMFRFARI